MSKKKPKFQWWRVRWFLSDFWERRQTLIMVTVASFFLWLGHCVVDSDYKGRDCDSSYSGYMSGADC